MRSNRFARLPPSLSSATALRRLLLARNPQLQLAPEDLAVLQCMSGLTELQLPPSTAESIPAPLREWLGTRLHVVA